MDLGESGKKNIHQANQTISIPAGAGNLSLTSTELPVQKGSISFVSSGHRQKKTPIIKK